ncbi:MAG: pyrrolidone-carboxylate peptidase [Verrucomicrobiota bacterium]|jgi:pyroglutamyl-peptidase
MKLLVTAFGPFGGRELNASSLALAGLRKSFPGLRTRVLPVDAVIAPSRLIQAIRLIQPDALLMLGEAGGSREIRLETTAWNELDFRIPDIAGRQYIARPIRRGAPVSLSSTLPLTEIHERLFSQGHPVTFSEDPGRYLCNQVFFRAMNHLAQNHISIPAGFIHLPLERELPTHRAVEAISEVIMMLRGG